MGHSHSGHPHPPGQCGGRQFPEHSDGAEQSEKSGQGCKGTAAEGPVSVGFRGLAYAWDRHVIGRGESDVTFYGSSSATT